MDKTKAPFQIYRLFTKDGSYNQYHSTSRGMKGIEDAAKKNKLTEWSYELTDFVCKNMSSAMKKCNELNSTEGVNTAAKESAEVMRDIMREHRQNADTTLTLDDINRFITKLEHGLSYYKSMKERLEGGNENGN